MDAETPLQVRGYTLYSIRHEADATTSHWYMMFRHPPEGGVAAALPDDLRVVFDKDGRPEVRAKLAPVAPGRSALGPVPAGATFSAVLLK